MSLDVPQSDLTTEQLAKITGFRRELADALDAALAASDAAAGGFNGIAAGTDQYGEGINMPEGQVDNYSDPSIASKTIIVWKGADNISTLLTGIDATGVDDDTLFFFVNAEGEGHEDCGQVILAHQHEDSLENNRIICPGHHPVVVPAGGVLPMLRRGGKWRPITANGWAKIAHIQSLCLYPNLQIGTPLAPLSARGRRPSSASTAPTCAFAATR
jgi:hypothetical protein